jgi:hypothetical protein
MLEPPTLVPPRPAPPPFEVLGVSFDPQATVQRRSSPSKPDLTTILVFM